MRNIQSIFKSILITTINVFILRSLEYFFIIQHHSYIKHLLIYELCGLLNDTFLFSALILLLSPLRRIHIFKNDYWLITLLSIYNILHIAIISYFSYQLELLDIFLFQYSLKEVVYTLNTSDVNIVAFIISILISVTTVLLCTYILNKKITKNINKYISSISIVIIIISIICYLFIQLTNKNKFIENKSVYFYKKSIVYKFFKEEYSDYNKSDAYHELFKNQDFADNNYPLLHEFKANDILGNLIQHTDSSPNIVILIIEGLNNDFIDKYHNVPLMPFLKELTTKSLYWNKCFTLGERSFAVLPSIIGGLPYGEKGFTLLERYPYHNTLISVLNKNNYYTSFFYGQGSWFHNKSAFLNYNNIDLIVDNSKFSPDYKKIIVDDFFWGYNDKDLFDQSLKFIDTLSRNKRLDIFFTGTSHSPFKITDQEYYNEKLKKLVNNHDADASFFEIYKQYFLSLLFVDDALKNYFTEYQKRDDFDNTLFIITGDHPMTELPIKNSLKRYHVPLIIYSPQLQKPRIFNGVVSHLDIYETILAYLSKNYNLKVPQHSASMGNILDTLANNEKHHLAFMNDNRDIVDFYSKGYYLSDNKLFKVDENLNLVVLENDSIKESLSNKLSIVKETSYFTSTKNRIVPVDEYCKNLSINKVYYSQDISNHKIKSEFYNTITQLPVANQNHTMELSLDYTGISDNTVSIVFELKDSKKDVVFWKDMGLPDKQKSVQYRIDLPLTNSQDSVLFLNTYIWNRERSKIEISNLNTLIYND